MEGFVAQFCDQALAVVKTEVQQIQARRCQPEEPGVSWQRQGHGNGGHEGWWRKNFAFGLGLGLGLGDGMDRSAAVRSRWAVGKEPSSDPARMATLCTKG